MPIEEDTFYDVNGYEVSRTNLVQQMIDYYNDKLMIGETRVTDFNEGSEIRNLLEAVAVDVYNLMEELNDLSSSSYNSKHNVSKDDLSISSLFNCSNNLEHSLSDSALRLLFIV